MFVKNINSWNFQGSTRSKGKEKRERASQEVEKTEHVDSTAKVSVSDSSPFQVFGSNKNISPSLALHSSKEKEDNNYLMDNSSRTNQGETVSSNIQSDKDSRSLHLSTTCATPMGLLKSFASKTVKQTKLTSCDQNPLLVRKDKWREFREDVKRRKLESRFHDKKTTVQEEDNGFSIKGSSLKVTVKKVEKVSVLKPKQVSLKNRKTDRIIRSRSQSLVKVPIEEQEDEEAGRETRDSQDSLFKKRRRLPLFPSDSSDSDSSCDSSDDCQKLTLPGTHFERAKSLPPKGSTDSIENPSDELHLPKGRVRISRVKNPQRSNSIITRRVHYHNQEVSQLKNTQKESNISITDVEMLRNDTSNIYRKPVTPGKNNRRNDDFVPGRKLLLKFNGKKETKDLQDMRGQSSKAVQQNTTKNQQTCFRENIVSANDNSNAILSSFGSCQVSSVVSVVKNTLPSTTTCDNITTRIGNERHKRPGSFDKTSVHSRIGFRAGGDDYRYGKDDNCMAIRRESPENNLIAPGIPVVASVKQYRTFSDLTSLPALVAETRIRNCSRRSRCLTLRREVAYPPARSVSPKAWKSHGFVATKSHNFLHERKNNNLYHVRVSDRKVRSQSVSPPLSRENSPNGSSDIILKQSETSTKVVNQDLSLLFTAVSIKCNDASSASSPPKEILLPQFVASVPFRFYNKSHYLASRCRRRSNETRFDDRPVYQTNIARLSENQVEKLLHRNSMASNDMNICNGFSTYRSSNVITNDEMSSTPQDPRMYKSKEKSITDAARAADHARRMKERLNRFQNDPRSTTLPQIVRPGNEEWLACSRTPSKYNRHLLRVENLRTQFTPVAVSHNGNRIKNIITKTHGDDEPLGTRKKPTSITLTEFESVGTVSSETNDLEPTASLSVSNSSGDISSETLVQTPALNQLKDSSVGGVDVTSFINCHSPDVSATGLSLMSVFNIEKEYAVNVQKALAGREKETTDLEGTKGLISQSSVTQIKVGSETVTSEVSTDVGIPHQIPNLDDIDDFSPQPMVIVSDNESNDAIPCALPSSSPITSEEEDHFMFTTSPEDNVESHAAADDNSGKLPKNTCLSLKIEIDELPHAGQIEDPHVTTREKLSSKGSDSGKGSSPKQCTECFRCLNKSRTKKGKSSNKKKKKNEKSRSWHRQKDFYPNSTSSDDEEQPRGRRYKTTDLSQGRSPPIRRSSFNRSCSRSRRSPSRELRTSGSSSRHKFSIRETRRMTLKYATQHDTSKTHEKCGWEQIDPDRPVFVHPQRMRKTGITDDLQIERETRKRSWDGLHPVSDAFDLPDKDPRVNKTLYIGNLDPSVSEEELKALFEEYGKVMLLFIKKFEAKKVYGFVKFQNLFESYRAKTHLHNKRLGKHRLNIGYARLVPSNRLWLGNLPKDLDSMFIYRELDRFGSITEMRHFRQDGEIDVTYESTAAAQVARNDMRGVILAKKEEFDNNGALTNKGTPHSEDPLLGKIRGIVTDFNEEAFKVVQTSDGSFSKRIRFNKDFENQDSSETQVVWQSCYISNGAQE